MIAIKLPSVYDSIKLLYPVLVVSLVTWAGKHRPVRVSLAVRSEDKTVTAFRVSVESYRTEINT